MTHVTIFAGPYRSGRDQAEMVAPRALVVQLRKGANGAGMPAPVHWFSKLDLDFGVSDPAEVAAGIEDVLKSLEAAAHSPVVIDLWRLVARAYRDAKKNDDAYRCQSMAAECLVAEAESAASAMVASHHLSAAIAELHGIPGKKDRRTELRHRLIDTQARVSEEMSMFSQEMDLREIADQVEQGIIKLSLVDKLLFFADLVQSPEPGTRRDYIRRSDTDAAGSNNIVAF